MTATQIKSSLWFQITQQFFSKIKYPIVCREKGIEGVVKVKITVDKRGQIRRYRILESPCSDLREAVEQVLPSLEFEPATVEGREVNSKIVIPVDFRLTY